MSLSKERLEYLKVAHPASKTELDPKQVLLDKLKLYRGILTGEKLEYLESLIELETSAVRNELSLEEQQALLDLGLYRDIVRYNIGHRTKKILESLNVPEMKIALAPSGDVSATLCFDKEHERYNVFFYCQVKVGKEFPSPEERETKDARLGHIHLYRFLIDDVVHGQEFHLLQTEIQKKKDFFEQVKEGKIKIRAYEELTDADRKLNQLKSRLKNLQEPITDQTRYVSDVVEAAHNALLSDYGIENESFEWPHHQGLDQVYVKLYNGDYSTCLKKTLVKRKPGLLLTDNITYR